MGIENYFASLSSFEQHFCTLWNFSFSRLYFSLKPLQNRLRRCCFKTIFSTAVIIYFPLRTIIWYPQLLTAWELLVTISDLKLKGRKMIPARPHNCCCEWSKMAPQYTAKMRTFMAVEYNKRAGTRDFVDGIIQDFVARYPGRAPPSQRTILRQAKKLDTFSTLHNLNSKVTFRKNCYFSSFSFYRHLPHRRTVEGLSLWWPQPIGQL